MIRSLFGFKATTARAIELSRNFKQFARQANDEKETRELGKKLAKISQKGDVISLIGEMGSGKTVFCQGFIQQLTQDPHLKVTSPTYLLDNLYIRQWSQV
jgi:tRNA threonylcarbamoyl adenosine modification protein YjeE